MTQSLYCISRERKFKVPSPPEPAGLRFRRRFFPGLAPTLAAAGTGSLSGLGLAVMEQAGAGGAQSPRAARGECPAGDDGVLSCTATGRLRVPQAGPRV